jgi:alpha-ketoglutarate-dependent taurine dioxygenase
MVDLPGLQVRWRWEPGSVALWDDVACNHCGANDYHPARRVMVRMSFFSREVDRLEPWTGDSANGTD